MRCDKTVKNYNFTEAQSYIFFGVLTTAVNFITYVFFTKALGIDYKIAASLAWVAAVIFAFITNKLYVFKSAATSALAVAKELGSFLFFRILSYFVDIFSIIVLVEVLGVLDTISKIVASAIVAVCNYFASKYVIFNRVGGSD